MQNAILIRPGVPVQVVFFLPRASRARKSSSQRAPPTPRPTLDVKPVAAKQLEGDWTMLRLDRVSRA